MVEIIIKHVIYTNKRCVPVHPIVLLNLQIYNSLICLRIINMDIQKGKRYGNKETRAHAVHKSQNISNVRKSHINY